MYPLVARSMAGLTSSSQVKVPNLLCISTKPATVPGTPTASPPRVLFSG